MDTKRVERICRREGLKVRQDRLWLNDGSCIRLRPAHRGNVWSYDFVAYSTHDGNAFRMVIRFAISSSVVPEPAP